MKKKKEKPLWKTTRLPLPLKSGGPHGHRRGAKGYRREKIKDDLKELVEEEREEEEE